MFLLGVICCSCLAISFADSGAYNDLGAAHDHVLSGYNKHVLPKVSHTMGVNVSLDLTIIQLDEIEEEDGEVGVIVWLSQRWNDPRLSWDSEAFHGVNTLAISSEEIWVPDISFYNSVKKTENVFAKDVEVNSNGDVKFVPALRVRVSCPIKEDSVEVMCNFYVGSWVFDDTNVDVYPAEKHMAVTTLYTNPVWSCQYIGGEHETNEYPCCPGKKYARVVFTAKFLRNKAKKE